jgi:hypothetical protein
MSVREGGERVAATSLRRSWSWSKIKSDTKEKRGQESIHDAMRCGIVMGILLAFNWADKFERLSLSLSLLQRLPKTKESRQTREERKSLPMLHGVFVSVFKGGSFVIPCFFCAYPSKFCYSYPVFLSALTCMNCKLLVYSKSKK